MESRQQVLDNIWGSLSEMPRMKLNALLAQMGLAKTMYAKLPDEQARKLTLGIFTRFDDATLQEVEPLVRA
jgi:SpoVK/Ycf46/Vps4 family AAA+-type ATPase